MSFWDIFSYFGKGAKIMKPTVSTSSASNVGTTNATLNATVNPNGAATTYYFSYGTTTGYGSNTPSGGIGSGKTAVSVGGTLTGLTAGTTYHFRVTATNSGGTVHGADQSFTTVAVTPVPVPPGPTPTGTPAQQSGLTFGVYDNAATFGNQKMTYELIWAWWDTFAAGWLTPQLKSIDAKGRIPILTIEPWPIATIGTAATLFADIVAGKYDPTIAKIAADITAFGKPVLIRWGHEMDNSSGYYPWAMQAAPGYVSAFQHVVTFFRSLLPGCQYLWTPIGDNASCTAYYPGVSFVDIVGCSLYEYAAASNLWYGGPQTFSQLLTRKWPQLSTWGKPIIVAEGGVAVGENQAQWMDAAFASAKNFPGLTSFVYFNAQDSIPWGANLPAPSFIIDPTVFT